MITPPLIGMSTVAYVALGLILGLGLSFVLMYNKLVRLRQSCKESWAGIDTELQRRHDLIPNLIETVKGYATHEQSVLEEVTDLRNRAVADKDKSPAARAEIEDQLGKAAGGLVATFEAYPDLKANQNFLQLQNELGETETRLAQTRSIYNTDVRNFANDVQMFPSSIVAGLGGFKDGEFEYFKADETAREAVQVDFDS